MSMNIRQFCTESGLVLAELAGERYTGEVSFTVHMRQGSIAKVESIQRSQMVARQEPSEGGLTHVARLDNPKKP